MHFEDNVMHINTRKWTIFENEKREFGSANRKVDFQNNKYF